LRRCHHSSPHSIPVDRGPWKSDCGGRRPRQGPCCPPSMPALHPANDPGALQTLVPRALEHRLHSGWWQSVICWPSLLDNERQESTRGSLLQTYVLFPRVRRNGARAHARACAGRWLPAQGQGPSSESTGGSTDAQTHAHGEPLPCRRRAQTQMQMQMQKRHRQSVRPNASLTTCLDSYGHHIRRTSAQRPPTPS
jgi:hypothetical protein